MKRTLLMLVVAGLATLVGGAVKEDRITILKVKALPLRVPVPTQGYQPFTPSDVIFIGEPVSVPAAHAGDEEAIACEQRLAAFMKRKERLVHPNPGLTTLLAELTRQCQRMRVVPIRTPPGFTSLGGLGLAFC